jgi:hypothetical protein
MSFHRYLSRIRHSLQGNRSARRAKKRQQRPRLTFYRPYLEHLEDRTLLTGFVGFANGLQSDLGNLQGQINTVLNAVNQTPTIPFVGNQLGKVPQGVVFTQNVLSEINTAISSASDTTSLQSDLQSQLGSLAKQVVVTQNNDTDSTVSVQVLFHQDLAKSTLPINFDLGLPGIPLAGPTTGGVNLSVGFDYDLAVTFDPTTNAITFDTAQQTNHLSQSTLQNNAMVLDVNATLPSSFTAQVTLGFLQGTIKDNPQGPTNLTASIGLNDLDGNNLSSVQAAAPTGSAHIDVDFTAGFQQNGTPINGFPTVSTTINLNWTLGQAPSLEFDDVTMNLGSFFETTLGPILGEIEKFTEPLKPFVSILTTPIPGLSDLSHAVGGPDITIESLLGTVDPQLGRIITLVTTIVDDVNLFNQIGTSLDSTEIHFGTFKLQDDGDLRNLPQANQPGASLTANLTNLAVSSGDITLPSSTVSQQLSAVGGDGDQLINNLSGSSLNFQLPILNDSTSLFKVLLGEDTDLVKFDASFTPSPLVVGTSFPVFGIITANFQVTLGLKASVELDYDTYGLREVLNDVQTGQTVTPQTFLDGFYFDVPNTYLSLNASISGGVGVSVVLASIAVDAVLSANLNITPNDPDNDGKLRFSEIESDIQSGCVVTLSGQVNAGLEIILKVGVDLPFVGFVGYEKDFTIAQVTLVNFGSGPCGMSATPPPPPVLAGFDSNVPGQLDLYTGPYHNLLQNVKDMSNGNEKFVVTDMGGTAGDETIGVTAFGYTQVIPHVKTILADGQGDNSDIITLGSNKTPVLDDATMYGGNANNQLTYLGSGHVVIYGGGNNDRLTIGPQAQDSTIYGGSGNEILTAGGGNDTLYGGGGPNDEDTFFGGVGNATMYGGQGTNQFNAGPGSATMYGGTASGTAAKQNLFTWTAGNGPIEVNGEGTQNTLEVDDNSKNADTINMGSSNGDLSVQFNGNSVIDAAGIQQVNLDTHNSPDSVTVNDLTPTSVQTVAMNLFSEASRADGVLQTYTLNGPSGAKTVNIREISASGTLTNSQNGNTTTTNVTGTVTQVKGLGPTFLVANPDDSLIVNPGNGNTTVNINTPTQTGALTVNGGVGVNQFNVQAIAGPTTINTTGGQNTINVGSNAPFTGGTLSGIVAALTLNGSGGSDTANVDDTGDTSPQSGTLTPTTLTGLGMGPNGITYSGLSFLNIALGSGGNTFTINVPNGTNLPATTTVDGGTGYNSLSATFVQDMNGTLLLTDFEQSTIQVGGNLNGYLSDTSPGSVQLLTIGGSLTATGEVVVGSLDTLSIAQDLAGSLLDYGNLGTASIGNNLSGSLTVDGNATTVEVGADVSGLVDVVGSLATLTIGGSLTGTGLVTVGQNLNTMSVGANLAGQVLVGQALSYLTVGQDLSGFVSETGTMQQVLIGGSLTYTGIVNASNSSNPAAANIVFMAIGPNYFSPGHDMAGQIIVSGTLTLLRVAGGTPGTIVAGQVGQVLVYGGYGPLVSQIKENGIQRRVEAAVPANPYPLPNPPGQQPPPNDLPNVFFQYIYEGTSNGLANPQLTVRVTNNASTAPDQYDLSLVVYSDTAKFNLARLDAAGVSGIRNVAVEGDLLTSVSQAAINFLGGDNTPAGVRLPLDNLAGVGIRDYAPLGFIQAASIEAVAFGSTTDEQGNLVTGPNAMATDAEDLLTPGTLIVQASDTFRVPFADALPVAFFMDTQASDHQFDSHDVLFTDQVANDARGAVTALVNVTVPVNPPNASTIQTIDLRGDGGAIQTQQAIVQRITSTGPLGDLILTAAGGLVANVTAPSIFGNIEVQGPISGIIQTTGLYTNPITGVTSTIPAVWGTITNGPVPSTTVVYTQGGGIVGQLISRGNFLSMIEANGGIDGVIAVQGNLGAQSGGVRLGGINMSNGSITGEVVVLGNVYGDIIVPSGLKDGRIAVQGSILGNTLLTGGIDASSALVAGGNIGDVTAGTGLTAGTVLGILAANGAINLVGPTDTSKASFFKYTKTADFFQDNLSIVDPTSAAAIDSIFTSDLSGLALMLQNLEDLSVSSSGELVL